MSIRWTTLIARAILVAWAAFWTWFCIASAIGEKEGWVGALMHQVPAAIMVLSTVIGWRWPRAGGALLIAEGIYVASGQWVRPHLQLFAMLGLPPLIAGILLLIGGFPAKGGNPNTLGSTTT